MIEQSQGAFHHPSAGNNAEPILPQLSLNNLDLDGKVLEGVIRAFPLVGLDQLTVSSGAKTSPTTAPPTNEQLFRLDLKPERHPR